VSVVTRALITDADTGEQGEAFSFKLGQPATKADVEALYEFLVSKSPPGLLKIATARLAELEGFPEYKGAARAIETGEHFAALGDWQRVSAAVSDFSASYERAMRRRDLRLRKLPQVEGAKKAAEIRSAKIGGRDAEIRARFESLVEGGMSPVMAKRKCATERDLSRSRIRIILGPDKKTRV
jgi:hypothetical protein